MTIIIRVGDYLLADKAFVYGDHVHSHQKLYRLEDGTVFGLCGPNPSLSMVRALKGADLFEAFKAETTAVSDAAMLVIHGAGRDCEWYSWQQDKACRVFVPLTDMAAVGCYWSSWGAYLRANWPAGVPFDEPCADRETAQLRLAEAFCGLVNTLNGLQPRCQVIKA